MDCSGLESFLKQPFYYNQPPSPASIDPPPIKIHFVAPATLLYFFLARSDLYRSICPSVSTVRSSEHKVMIESNDVSDINKMVQIVQNPLKKKFISCFPVPLIPPLAQIPLPLSQLKPCQWSEIDLGCLSPNLTTFKCLSDQAKFRTAFCKS